MISIIKRPQVAWRTISTTYRSRIFLQYILPGTHIHRWYGCMVPHSSSRRTWYNCVHSNLVDMAGCMMGQSSQLDTHISRWQYGNKLHSHIRRSLGSWAQNILLDNLRMNRHVSICCTVNEDLSWYHMKTCQHMTQISKYSTTKWGIIHPSEEFRPFSIQWPQNWPQN